MNDDPAPDPNDGLADSAALEEDIDRLLADAATLASDVSEEVGEAEPDPSMGTAPDPDPSQDVAADVDAQLANIEAMAAEASAEVGPVGDGPADSDAQQPPADAIATVPDPAPRPAPPVPDFMAEFTRPEPPSDEPDGDDAAPSADRTDEGATAPAPPVPTTAELAKKGVVSSKTIHASEPGTGPFGDADDEYSIRVPGEPEGLTDATERKASFPVWLGKATPVLLPLAEFAVRLLERLDAPTARVGGGLRQVIGWLAIATFGTSLIVLLISLF